eukprot:2690341-Rhodomonas_salina.1
MCEQVEQASDFIRDGCSPPPPQLPALADQHWNWIARFDLLECWKDTYLMRFKDLTEQTEANISDQKYQWLCPKED